MCCELTPEAVATHCHHPLDAQAVVIKLFPKEFFFESIPLEKALENQMLSDYKLSPRLLYANDECFIHEFIKVSAVWNQISFESDYFFPLVAQLQLR